MGCYTSALVWITLPSPTTAMPATTGGPGPPTIDFTTQTMTATDNATQATTVTTMPPTSPNDDPNTSTVMPKIDSIISKDSPTSKKPDVDTQARIPDEVSILFIVVAALCIVIVLGAGTWFLYKKLSNHRKRKNSSVLPLDGSTVIQAHGEDGSTVIQSHGGVLKCEDIETVKYRASAQT